MAGERIRLDEASTMEKAPKSEAEEKAQIAPKEAPIGTVTPTSTARKQNLPIWKRREEFLRERGTTPRNLYDTDILAIKAPDSVKKNVRFLWASEPLWRNRPILPGFRYDIWEPVTKAVAEEMGIEVATRDFTPEGTYKAGHDAFLMWAPESVAREYDEYVARGADAKTLMRAAEAELNEKLEGQNSKSIGSILVTNSEKELAEAEARERQDLGSPLQ